MMNHSRRTGGGGKKKALKTVTMVMGMCIVGYIVGPPLYWHLYDIFFTFALHSSSSSSPYCPSCLCDCSSQPLLSLPDGLINQSFTECMKHDPQASEEAERSFTDLLAEEVRLKEEAALERQHRGDVALLEKKKLASQYQKEADKCNAGMETCEEARERAEAMLNVQRDLSQMWELRARQRGWRDGV